MKIGEIALKTGVSRDAVRQYEKVSFFQELNYYCFLKTMENFNPLLD
jgi:hypothetical protein